MPTLLSRRLVLLALLPTPAARALVGERPSETMVKAALLHKFASFVEWPPGAFLQPDSAVRIGVLGDEGMARSLIELASDRPRDGRPVLVVTLRPTDAMPPLHILYVKASTRGELLDVLQRTPAGVLTVSDFQGEYARRSVISFASEGDRIRFGISPEMAAQQRLVISPRLLPVAQILPP